MSANLDSNMFFKLTTQKVDRSGAKTQGSQQAQGAQQTLKTTDVYTAEKQGIRATGRKKEHLAGGDSGFSGTNVFGDSGFGDTVQFSTKGAQKADDTKAPTFAGKFSGGMNVANNDSEIKKLAEMLGCEADENVIKNKLQGMNPDELVKLDGDALDIAADMGMISMSDIDRKLGANNDANSQPQEENPAQKLKFGTFTSGSEV